MDLPQSLIDAVKDFEGFSATPTWDFKQYSSGYGTKAASPDEQIDQNTANQRLTEALGKAADQVNAINPSMPEGVRNALISLTYNAGRGWMNAGLGDLVRAGDWAGAKERFLQYNKAGGEVNKGLVNRRQQEAFWFDAPDQRNLASAIPVQTAGLMPAQNTAPLASQISASTIPAGATFGMSSAPPQQQSAPSYLDQLPAQAAMPPPEIQFHRPRVNLAQLKATFQPRQFGGIFYS